MQQCLAVRTGCRVKSLKSSRRSTSIAQRERTAGGVHSEDGIEDMRDDLGGGGRTGLAGKIQASRETW